MRSSAQPSPSRHSCIVSVTRPRRTTRKGIHLYLKEYVHGDIEHFL